MSTTAGSRAKAEYVAFRMEPELAGWLRAQTRGGRETKSAVIRRVLWAACDADEIRAKRERSRERIEAEADGMAL
jgi:hypothetical protein